MIDRPPTVSPQRVTAWTLGIFGGVALALALVGIYGVMAYAVSERRREIGIRVAFGARRADVMRLVVGEGALLVALAIALGLAGAWVATRLIAKQLYGVAPNDPLTFAGATALLAAVALAACWIPARRAARVDPMVAMRNE